ncbi:hypothetical protein JZ751_014580 [Albula glossodonta]|uniref:Uncharacterized protein n=1 Tax=Albula glossodonta TaxID=121402 RepID=A0A8T2N465_9TELE|nr:hypothetical protein JZ751_014580 [Albula glossodonta]
MPPVGKYKIINVDELQRYFIPGSRTEKREKDSSGSDSKRSRAPSFGVVCPPGNQTAKWLVRLTSVRKRRQRESSGHPLSPLRVLV